MAEGGLCLVLPTVPADWTETATAHGNLTGWPCQKQEVLVVRLAFAPPEEQEEENAQLAEGAAAKKKKPQGKDELREKLGLHEDPYAMLELSELRWRATAEDIRKSYRRLVLQYHPDKQGAANKALEEEEPRPDEEKEKEEGGEEEESEEDAMFKALTKAYDLLSDPKKRREFDSLDEFDDSIPREFDAELDDFFEEFGPVFERNSRFSEVQPAPLLGDADTSFEELADFYNFWFSFKSWRDFADEDEYDVEEAGFREEKRWMERENDKRRAKRRKEESKRVGDLVEMAYAYDPRISAMKKAQKEAKEKARQDKLAQAQREKEQKAAEEAEAARRKEEEKRLEAEEAARKKKEKDKEKDALRKRRAKLRKLAESVKEVTSDQVESLCAALALDRLTVLCEVLTSEPANALNHLQQELAILEDQKKQETQAAEKASAMQAAAAAQAAAAVQVARKGPPWTEKELDLLAKGSVKFPGGVPDRWAKITDFINHLTNGNRHPDETIEKMKDLKKLGREKLMAQAQANRDLPTSPTPAPSASQPTSQPVASPLSTAAPILAAPVLSVEAPVLASAPILAPPATAPKTANPQPDPAKKPKAAKKDSTQAPSSASSPAPATQAKEAKDPKTEVKEEDGWSAAQQSQLEKALKQFPASTAERWDRIAEVVEGKTKSQCVARFKQIVAAIKAKKQASS